MGSDQEPVERGNRKMNHSEPVRPQSAPATDFASIPLDVLRAHLRSSPMGLTPAEAQARLTQSGYNELPEEKQNPLLKLLSYFWDPIAWMIEVACL